MILEIHLSHGFFSFLLPLATPSRQRRPSLNNITCSPSHTLLVLLLCNIVVGADDVEFVLPHLLIEIICHLFRCPSSSWLHTIRRCPCLQALSVSYPKNGSDFLPDQCKSIRAQADARWCLCLSGPSSNAQQES